MSQEITAWAPGRVNLIGEHTDHTDGLALPMAIEQGVSVSATVGGATIALTSGDEPPIAVAADGSTPPDRGWGRYVSAVAAELHAMGRPPVGVRGSVSSTLQAGIGLSSSAALEVAVAVALLRAARAYGWDGRLETGSEAGGRLTPRDLALACRRAEHEAVGVPSGVLDQAASLLGAAGSAILLDCSDVTHDLVPIPPETTVVIIDSGVRRQLESSGYADRTRELGASLHVLGGRRPADIDPAELPELLAGLADVPARRLRHVVTENDRVRRTVTAFADGDRQAIRALFDDSHASLRDDFEVTVSETDALAALMVGEGAIGARMTGGGFGGAVIGLAEASAAEALATRVVQRYRERFPDRTAVTLISSPADGAAVRAPDVLCLSPGAHA